MQLSEVGAPILFLFSFSLSIRIGQERYSPQQEMYALSDFLIMVFVMVSEAVT